MAKDAPMIKIEVSKPDRGKCKVMIFTLDSVSADGKAATYLGTGPLTVSVKPRVRD